MASGDEQMDGFASWIENWLLTASAFNRRNRMADPRIQGGVKETVVQNGWSLGMEQT